MRAPQGWYDDPTGRHQQRYFDGSGWTEHVATGGTAGVDPVSGGPHAEPPIPAVEPQRSTGPPTAVPTNDWTTPPAGAAAGPTAPNAVGTSGARSGTFLDSLGRDAVERPRPDFPTAVGGIGGYLVGGGLVALIAQSGEQVAIVIAGLLTFGGALAVMLLVVPKLRFLASPAVSAATVGIFTVTAGLVLSEDGLADATNPSNSSCSPACSAWWRSSPRASVGGPSCSGSAWSPCRSRSPAWSSEAESCNSFENDCNEFESAAGSFGLSSGAGIVLAIVGCAMLFLVRKLDALGRPGIATTVAAACIVNLGIGAFALAVDLGNTGGPLLIAAAGVALGIVGHLGRRRGLTWTGAALTVGGFVVAVGNLVDPDSGTLGGIVAILTGAVVIGAPVRIQPDRRRTSRIAIRNAPPTDRLTV